MTSRIFVNDYGGYSFILDLGRNLADRGYKIGYFFAGYNSKLKDIQNGQSTDQANLSIKALYTEEELKKYRFVKRWQQEQEYGNLLVKEIKSFKPDIILSANTPLDAQKIVLKYAQKSKIPFIFWLQDMIGIATKNILLKKFSIIGVLIGQYYFLLEKKLLRESDHIILISEDFQGYLDNWGIPENKTTVIPNWASLEHIAPKHKKNLWSIRYQVEDKFCFIYSGSLGMKHNPDLLFKLALKYQDQKNIKVVVISEGPGADWLHHKKIEYNLENLILLPFQPYEEFPLVMGAADVLVAILEKDAGEFSIPSKVLTYLCSQRPLLLAISLNNMAARIVLENDAGIVVEPDDLDSFLDKSEILINNPHLCKKYANNARAYAESKFDINIIGDQFERIISSIA